MEGTAIATGQISLTIEHRKTRLRHRSNRIYLLGYCEAGRTALLLAERYPRHFAAVGAEARA